MLGFNCLSWNLLAIVWSEQDANARASLILSYWIFAFVNQILRCFKTLFPRLSPISVPQLYAERVYMGSNTMLWGGASKNNVRCDTMCKMQPARNLRCSQQEILSIFWTIVISSYVNQWFKNMGFAVIRTVSVSLQHWRVHYWYLVHEKLFSNP